MRRVGVLNPNYNNTYLIKLFYEWNDQYIVTDDELISILKNFNQHDIDFIKYYDVKEYSFVEIDKKEIVRQISLISEEAKNYITNHYYFK